MLGEGFILSLSQRLPSRSGGQLGEGRGEGVDGIMGLREKIIYLKPLKNSPARGINPPALNSAG
jgi:hypothetical protein